MTRQIDHDATLEDLTFLADHGVGVTEAAKRTGFPSVEALDRWLRRIGQPELCNRLWRQDYESVTPSRKEHHLGGRRAS